MENLEQIFLPDPICMVQVPFRSSYIELQHNLEWKVTKNQFQRYTQVNKYPKIVYLHGGLW